MEDRREVFGMREVRCQFVFCLLLVCFLVAAYCCCWRFVLCLLRRWLLFAGEQILKRDCFWEQNVCGEALWFL